ncbi:hypothetical protein H0H92_011289 [Tricholoma furcatifolium]|nr:hypothetical protein H0H92_011289 [Tricholoma furcatifolium]
MLWLKALPALLLCLCVVQGSLVDEIVNAIQDATSCAACHALLVPLQALAVLGNSAFTNAIIGVCKVVGIEDDDVCEGIIGQQGPILAHDLRSISVLGQTATKICDSALGLCQPPEVNAYTVPFPQSAPTNPKVWISKGRAPFQVSHFSDVHIDRHYTPGADANCTKPICCREYADSSNPPAVPAGPIGAHNCDTSPALARSLLEVIPASNAFSIFTGDVVEAAVWLVDETEVTSDLMTFNNEMASLLKTPVYPAIGNHEVAPINLYPRSTADTPDAAQWVYDTQSRGWETWINSTAASDVENTSGCYSVVHPGTSLRYTDILSILRPISNCMSIDVRVISINTGYWYKANFRKFDGLNDRLSPDPNGIFAFLVQELQAAEDAGQRAWIIGHMAPGRQDVLSDQSNYFDQVVQRYKNTIAAQFYGHSHQDQFEIAYSDYNNQTEANAAFELILSFEPMTQPWPVDGNPAFKMYDIDPDTYEVMNAYVYFATWQLYYSSRAMWGPLVNATAEEPLGPAFWHRVTELFETNTTAFQQYNTFLTRGYNVKEVSKPGLSLRRRDEDNSEAHSIGDACEGRNLGNIFSQLPALFSDPTFNVTALKMAMENAIENAHQLSWNANASAQAVISNSIVRGSPLVPL